MPLFIYLFCIFPSAAGSVNLWSLSQCPNLLYVSPRRALGREGEAGGTLARVKLHLKEEFLAGTFFFLIYFFYS